MRRAKICTVIGIVVLGLCFSSSSIANEAKEATAVAAAKTWLALVDEGIYGDSWETAAAYFRRAITKEKWVRMLTAVRDPLGNTVSRELSSKTYTQSLPGAPDGEYVVIQFETSFQNKKSAIETITPMLDNDGEWRVSGYYIK
jgi:hypothetical protein